MSQELALTDVKVYVDFSQERQNRLGPYTFATDGTQIDAGTLVNCIIDPVNLSVMGRPLPMTEEWNDAGTACTGNYYRFKKSNFTFVDATKWREQDVIKQGNTYIYSGSASTADMRSVVRLNGAIGTTDAVDRNEPLFFSYRKNDKENTGNTPLVKLYWSNPTNKDKDTQLHFNSDGSCEVFRGYMPLAGIIEVSSAGTAVTGTNTKFLTQLNAGNQIYDFYGRLIGTVNTVNSDISITLAGNANNTFLGNYFRLDDAYDAFGIRYSGPQRVQKYSRTESNYSQERPISTIVNPNDRFCDVYIVPCRGKELLVMTSYGLNFSHSFSDLNTPDPPGNMTSYNEQGLIPPPNYASQPIILPSGGFSIQCTQGKLSWQLAKLNFLQNWECTSQRIKLASKPPYLPDYKTGTISCSFGSTIVSGSSSLFTSELASGDRLYWYENDNNLGSILLGTIDSIVSDTSLYLSADSIYQVSNSIYSRDQKLTGTIAFTAGNGAVIGTGTSFTSQLSINDKIYDNSGNYIGLVDGVVNNSSLALNTGPSFSGSGVTFWKNLNEYSNRFFNPQTEFFSSVVPTSLDELAIDYYITNDENNLSNQSLPTDVLFNNENDEFRIKIIHTNVDDSDPLASGDKGFMFYSLDDVYLLKNEKTYNSPVDITSAIERMNLSRSEEGAYNLRISARKKTLEDLGMDRPIQISNRPVKVTLTPRRELLQGQISYVGTGETLTGSGTSFLTELSVNSPIYLEDGTFIGIATTIDTNTSVGFWSADNNTYVNENYSVYPKGDEFNLYEGYLSSPEITYLNASYTYAQGVPTYENYALLEFNAIDKLAHLNKIYYAEAPNFDNRQLEDIFNKNIIYGGSGNNSPDQTEFFIDYTVNTFQIPLNRNNSNGQYNFVANLGDTVGGFLEKIRSDYAQNFTFFCRPDWYPNAVSGIGYSNYTSFKMMDQNFIPFNSQYYDLYLNEEIADSAASYGPESWKVCIRNLRRVYETPEANRIYIVGLDKTNGARIQYLKEDKESQNPYIAPANRPSNWLGDVAPFVMINDKLNSDTDVVQAGNQFYDKLTPGRNIIEFESDLITGWNNGYKFTPTNRTALTGTITTSSSSTVVNGFGTLFTTELSVADTLYDSLGNILGIVKTINSDTSLDFVSNSLIGYLTDVPFNNYTQYLNQYRYFDIGDIVNLYDEYLNNVFYRILSWDCEFIKETINADTINVRRANYRAKQISFDPTSPDPNEPEFNFTNNLIPAANSWIAAIGATVDMSFIAESPDPYKTISYSLSGEPAGMTIDSSTGAIEWTPSAGQENKIFTFSVEATDGINTNTKPVIIRTYDTL